jgi:hypothetical protein
MYRALLLASILCITACGRKTAPNSKANGQQATTSTRPVQPLAENPPPAQTYTDIILHDVQLQESAGVTLNVHWLRGRMYPAQAGVIPSLDNPRSFTLDVQDGVISVSLPDVAKLLNTRVLKGSPLSNIKLAAEGTQLKINGTLHKIIPIPIQVLADVGASADGQKIVLHIAKLDVLKIPVGGLLKAFDVKPAELIDPKQSKGIQINGNDVAVDTAQLLPPPRNIGKLTGVHVSRSGNFVEVYGSPRGEVTKFKQWRNFIRLRGGRTQIGKLTMEHTDILVVDTAQGDWFTFDLAQFPEQLVNGYARLTPQAGLQIFLPDFGKIPKTAANQRIDIEWVKNRNAAPPADIP